MKKVKKLLAVILCLVLMQAPLQLISQPAEVHAAAGKAKFYQKKGKYYYQDPDGTLVKNDWRTVRKTRAKYYFGKDGAAYAAEKNDFTAEKYHIITKKIGGKWYGFDTQGRMVTGLRVTLNGVVHYFNTKTGVLDSKRTNQLRNAVKKKNDVKGIRKLLDKIEKPRKTIKIDPCLGAYTEGTEYRYKYCSLQTARNPVTKKEIIIGVFSL